MKHFDTKNNQQMSARITIKSLGYVIFYTFTLQQSVGLRNVIMEVPDHTHICVVVGVGFVVVVVFPLFTETKVQTWDHFYKNLFRKFSEPIYICTCNSTHET